MVFVPDLRHDRFLSRAHTGLGANVPPAYEPPVEPPHEPAELKPRTRIDAFHELDHAPVQRARRDAELVRDCLVVETRREQRYELFGFFGNRAASSPVLMAPSRVNEIGVA